VISKCYKKEILINTSTIAAPIYKKITTFMTDIY